MTLKITEADIRRFAPGANQHYVEALLSGAAEIKAAGIDTPLRWCHFIAQAAHETGGFTIVREKCTWRAETMCKLWPHRFKMTDPVFRARYAMARGDEPKLAEMAYGYKVRPDLGNAEEGDGYDYRGGGFPQGTGRAWYREAGEATGYDLEGSPHLIEDPKVSLACYLWYWRRHKLNTFADANNLRAVGNAINRGNALSRHEPIGADDRRRHFTRAWAVWGTAQPIALTDMDVGASGTEVQAVQTRLRDLGYAPGNPDGIYGRDTARAVASFKADWARDRGTPLEPDTKVGPLTRAALAEAEPISRPEREQMTVAELADAGSTEVAAGRQIQKGGGLLIGAGVAGGAVQVGVDEAVKTNLSWIPAYQSMLVPAADGMRWMVSNALWVVPLLAGIWLYYGGYQVIRARLEAARRGWNMRR